MGCWTLQLAYHTKSKTSPTIDGAPAGGAHCCGLNAAAALAAVSFDHASWHPLAFARLQHQLLGHSLLESCYCNAHQGSGALRCRPSAPRHGIILN